MRTPDAVKGVATAKAKAKLTTKTLEPGSCAANTLGAVTNDTVTVGGAGGPSDTPTEGGAGGPCATREGGYGG